MPSQLLLILTNRLNPTFEFLAVLSFIPKYWKMYRILDFSNFEFHVVGRKVLSKSYNWVDFPQFYLWKITSIRIWICFCAFFGFSTNGRCQLEPGFGSNFRVRVRVRLLKIFRVRVRISKFFTVRVRVRIFYISRVRVRFLGKFQRLGSILSNFQALCSVQLNCNWTT